MPTTPTPEFNALLAQAEAGDAEAQYQVGQCYYHGEGVEKNLKEAVKWCQKAAKQEYAEAQFLLGSYYCQGIGIVQNCEKAFEWWEKAAKQGIAGAQFNVGLCYDTGEGVEKNEEKALYWLEKAKEQKFERATDYLIQRTARKKFEELIENQQQEFETKIKQQIATFENQKATIIEQTKQDIEKNNAVLLGNAKKELEKQAWWFSTILLVVMLAFIGIMFSYLTCSLDDIKETVQAQAGSPQIKIEQLQKLHKEVELLKTQLKAVEEKSSKLTPPKNRQHSGRLGKNLS